MNLVFVTALHLQIFLNVANHKLFPHRQLERKHKAYMLPSAIELMKSVKNAVEVSGMRNAQVSHIDILSVPARLGKGQGAKEIGHNLVREQPKFGHNLVRGRHIIGHSLERE